MASTMSSAQVRSLLQELAKRLDFAGISVGVRVVGGAALAVLDSDRRATADVDAVVVPAGAASEVKTPRRSMRHTMRRMFSMIPKWPASNIG